MSQIEDRDAGATRSAEKEFYLSEFRGRTLAIALAQAEATEIGALEGVLEELAANATGCVLLSSDRALLDKLAGDAVLELGGPTWAGSVWRRLRQTQRVGISVGPAAGFAARCREVALRLQFAKLVWIDRAGRLVGPGGTPMSLVDLAALDGMLADPAELGARASLLREIRNVIAGGVPSVNLCNLDGLADELFTYRGSGTFFTRERYILVRSLALDEFDAAHDLLSRGVSEGYLAQRAPEEIDQLLSHAFGVFVEGRYLAGIGALVPYPNDGVGEVAGLYTVTRFMREGIGGRLLRYAAEQAGQRGLSSLFACTTSERVEGFFERHGYRRVGHDELPASRWEGYEPTRRAQLRCLRFDL